MPRTGPEFIAAKMAERDERHRQMGNTRYVVEPNIKDGKGGLRDLNTLFWIGKYFYRVKTSAELVGKGVLSRRRVPAVPARRGFPLGHALPPAFPHRPRRREADLRRAARARRPPGLCRARRHARRRALHEALFPRRQGRRRPDPHLLHLARIPPRQAARPDRPRAGAVQTRQGGDQGRDGFRHRERPAQHRRPRRLREGPAQPDQGLPARRPARPALPPRRHQGDPPLAAPDRPRAAQRPAGQCLVPRDPDRRRPMSSASCGR